jgi:hypothetical protein
VVVFWHKQYVIVFLQTFLYMLKKLRSGRKEYCVQDVKNYAHHSGTICHIYKRMSKDKMFFDLYWQLPTTRRRHLERVQLLEHALQILCTILCVYTSVFSTFVNYLNKHNHMCTHIYTRPPHLYTQFTQVFSIIMLLYFWVSSIRPTVICIYFLSGIFHFATTINGLHTLKAS